MKREIRILGIDDASPVNDKAIVIGAIFRGGDFLDGIISCTVSKDGDDATEKIAEMIIKTKFRPQLRAVMLDGIAVAGFNVIDIDRLNRKISLPVIVVMREYPEMEKIKKTLKDLGMGEKLHLIEKAGKIYPFMSIHFQVAGINKEEAEQILSLSCTHSNIPEPLRVAHLIGQGIILGESRGRA